MTGYRARAFAGAALLLAASCGITGPELQADGTVRFDPIEGGCWLIQTSEALYQPIRLDEEFRQDGLRVRFEADILEDVAGFCPGTIVELESIEAIG